MRAECNKCTPKRRRRRNRPPTCYYARAHFAAAAVVTCIQNAAGTFFSFEKGSHVGLMRRGEIGAGNSPKRDDSSPTPFPLFCTSRSGLILVSFTRVQDQESLSSRSSRLIILRKTLSVRRIFLYLRSQK